MALDRLRVRLNIILLCTILYVHRVSKKQAKLFLL